jgi:hypothetical protein
MAPSIHSMRSASPFDHPLVSDDIQLAIRWSLVGLDGWLIMTINRFGVVFNQEQQFHQNFVPFVKKKV